MNTTIRSSFTATALALALALPLAARADIAAPQMTELERYDAALAECTVQVGRIHNANVGNVAGSIFLSLLTGFSSHGHNVVVPVPAINPASVDDCMADRGWAAPPVAGLDAPQRSAMPACWLDPAVKFCDPNAAQPEATEPPADSGTLGGELGVVNAGNGEGLGSFGAIDVFGIAMSYERSAAAE